MEALKEMSTKDILTLSKRFPSCFRPKLFVRFDLSLQLLRSLCPPFLFGQNSQQPEMSPTPEEQQSQLGSQLCVPGSWSWGQLLAPSPASHLQVDLAGLGEDFQLSPFSYYSKTFRRLSPRLFPFVFASGSEKDASYGR